MTLWSVGAANEARRMFQGFVFHVEGTLVDSVPQSPPSLQDAIERSGYRVPMQTLQLYSGLDGDQILQLCGSRSLGW
jgi:hypothetical protein